MSSPQNIHNSPSILFTYIKQNNMSNDFYESIEKQFTNKGILSEKQQECLENAVSRHKSITNFFNSYEGDNDFIHSIELFFRKNNYLSPKQYEALKKFVSKNRR
jgi:hypothetical protein